jgi:FKBP-type peptidyl-prolyl cis-trans isomerase
MTLSTARISLVVFTVFSAVALGLPHSALAQAPAQSTMAAQVENPPADAQKTASGVAYIIETPGTGTVHPTNNDMVKMTAAYWTRDSEVGKPGYLALPNAPKPMALLVLPGLHEALTLMTTGQKMKIWIPEKLAFNGAADKPKGPMMVELVLIDVIPLPTTPADVAAPPADAKTTKSGLASKVIKPGTGTAHPKSTSTVTVHYSLWTPDGKMVESSVVRGVPATFPLDKVIKGWTEGVQLMVTGESRRFWIPGKLAYDDSARPDAPKGMLVFDIELVAIDGNK